MDLLGILIGVPLGVLTSLIAWWILFHVVAPKIVFAPNLSRILDPDPVYRLKIRNPGFRDVLDCEVIAELRIKGLSARFKRNTWVLSIPVYNNRIAVLRSRTNRLVVFQPFEFSESERRALLDEMARQESFTMEDLFALGERPRLRVTIFGYDSFSGARKVFVSKDYVRLDLVARPYRLKSLAIKEVSTVE